MTELTLADITAHNTRMYDSCLYFPLFLLSIQRWGKDEIDTQTMREIWDSFLRS
jgi:hypothetical protein